LQLAHNGLHCRQSSAAPHLLAKLLHHALAVVLGLCEVEHQVCTAILSFLGSALPCLAQFFQALPAALVGRLLLTETLLLTFKLFHTTPGFLALHLTLSLLPFGLTLLLFLKALSSQRLECIVGVADEAFQPLDLLGSDVLKLAEDRFDLDFRWPVFRAWVRCGLDITSEGGRGVRGRLAGNLRVRACPSPRSSWLIFT